MGRRRTIPHLITGIFLVIVLARAIVMTWRAAPSWRQIAGSITSRVPSQRAGRRPQRRRLRLDKNAHWQRYPEKQVFLRIDGSPVETVIPKNPDTASPLVLSLAPSRTEATDLQTVTHGSETSILSVVLQPLILRILCVAGGRKQAQDLPLPTNVEDVFMRRELSVMTKARASMNLPGVPVTAFMLVLVIALAAGCAANRCCKKRSCCAQSTCCSSGCDAVGCDAGEAPVVPEPAPAVTMQEVQAPAIYAKPEPKPEPVASKTSTYGHGENYEWLIGKLQKVHVPRQGWKIRYARLDEKDKWGGSMVFSPDARLDSFQDGDVVYVEGDIISERASLYLAGPRYRVRNLRLFSGNHVAELPSR